MVRAARENLEPAPPPHDLVVIDRHHRDRGQIPPFNRCGVAAGFQPPAGRLELIPDRDDVAAGVSLRIREDPADPLHPRLETGLLANLADDRLDRRLAELDEAARQRGPSPIPLVLPTD